MKQSALPFIVPILVVWSLSAAIAQPMDLLDIGEPTRSVASSNYWTYALGPCYVPWYGQDYRDCGVRSRRSGGRASRRSGGAVYRQTSKGRVAAY